MNKTELVDRIAEAADISKASAGRALDAALGRSPSLVLEVEAVQATLFAVRTNCPLRK